MQGHDQIALWTVQLYCQLHVGRASSPLMSYLFHYHQRTWPLQDNGETMMFPTGGLGTLFLHFALFWIDGVVLRKYPAVTRERQSWRPGRKICQKCQLCFEESPCWTSCMSQGHCSSKSAVVDNWEVERKLQFLLSCSWSKDLSHTSMQKHGPKFNAKHHFIVQKAPYCSRVKTQYVM